MRPVMRRLVLLCDGGCRSPPSLRGRPASTAVISVRATCSGRQPRRALWRRPRRPLTILWIAGAAAQGCPRGRGGSPARSGPMGVEHVDGLHDHFRWYCSNRIGARGARGSDLLHRVQSGLGGPAPRSSSPSWPSTWTARTLGLHRAAVEVHVQAPQLLVHPTTVPTFAEGPRG